MYELLFYIIFILGMIVLSFILLSIVLFILEYFVDIDKFYNFNDYEIEDYIESYGDNKDE